MIIRRYHRIICVVGLPEKTLKNLNSKLARIVKKTRYDGPAVLAETIMEKTREVGCLENKDPLRPLRPQRPPRPQNLKTKTPFYTFNK